MQSAGPSSELPVLGAVARRSLPHLLEATLVPAALFYVVLVGVGAGAAMVATVCWSYGALARRLVLRQRVSSILMLSLVGLTARTLVGLWSGSTAVYFIQPVVTTVAMAALFLGSLLVRRPVVASLASDFCPLGPDVTSRPEVVRLFNRLTLLWAMVHLATAATTFGLLISLPVATFVAVKTLACLAITAVGVAITVSSALRTIRRENLVLPTAAGSPFPVAAMAHAAA